MRASLAAPNKKNFRKKEWLEYLINNPTIISEIPDNILKKIITEEVAYKIISENFSTICCIPFRILKKSFMYRIWLKREKVQMFDIIFFLKYSPSLLLDKKFCLECITSYPHAMVLEYFPSKCLTRRFWEHALNLNGLLIKSIRKESINSKLLLIAVNNNPMALKYIPVELRNKKLSQISIEKDVRAIMYAAFR